MVEPFKKRQSRGVIVKTPKFYLFDVGVAGAITKRRISEMKGESFGRALEHFIFMEIAAHSSYSELNYDIHYWRTKSGNEVDFILGGGEVAVEIKGQSRVDNRALRPLSAFMDEYKPKKALVVCNEGEERVVGGIKILPWQRFLEELWNGALFLQ
jgi:predicted AAA+ superfamily ATPase